MVKIAGRVHALRCSEQFLRLFLLPRVDPGVGDTFSTRKQREDGTSHFERF